MAFDKRTLVLPAGTQFEERAIVATGDFILGNHVACGFGLRTDGRLFAGQGVTIEGDVSCDGDLRLDQSTNIEGTLRSGANMYLGERCFVKGDLEVHGDLDVGDDVRVGGQLHARGWVNKRNPVPLVLYIFIYLLELMRLGQSEQVDQILKEMEDMDEAEIAVGDVYLFVPDHSKLGLQRSEIKGGLYAEENCRVLGNLVIQGDAVLGAGTCIHGALRVDGSVVTHPGSRVEGDLIAGGHVVVGEGAQILGDLRAKSVEMYTGASVDGRIVADDGVSFRTEAQVVPSKQTDDEAEPEPESKIPDLMDLLG